MQRLPPHPLAKHHLLKSLASPKRPHPTNMVWKSCSFLVFAPPLKTTVFYYRKPDKCRRWRDSYWAINGGWIRAKIQRKKYSLENALSVNKLSTNSPKPPSALLFHLCHVILKVSKSIRFSHFSMFWRYGGIAQPVERPPHTRKVTDSSSVVSTKKKHRKLLFSVLFLLFLQFLLHCGECSIHA